MKMVKSLLLGTAAGLVAVAGAQAADMPVKAKPVLYVKICSLYGDGFYYVPGTDSCLKIGGYVRVQYEYNAGGGGVPVGQSAGTANEAGQARFARDVTDDGNFRSRGVISMDMREQTQYGTLRAYIRFGAQVTSPTDTEAANAVFMDRAFIQFAGFTVGKSQSFFDIAGGLGDINYHNTRLQGDTGATGITLWAYTAQFGNGVSGSLSLENPQGHNKMGTTDAAIAGFFNLNAVVVADTAFAVNAAGNGFRMPDIVANLRVDQAWGYVGVSAALHDVSGAYYSPAGVANNVNNGHPADKIGWAAAVGGRLNLPGGDLFGANFCYSEGAGGFCTNNTAGFQFYNASTSVGIGYLVDGVFDTGTQVELTKVWSAVAYYQHVWNPRWRTSFYGGYVNIDYNPTATNILNSRVAGASVANCGVAAAATTFTAVTVTAGNSCNPDFSFYEIGTRTQFNPVPNLDIGLDLLYTHWNTAYKGPGVYATNLPRPAVNLFDDQNVWSAFVRWQRNFYP